MKKIKQEFIGMTGRAIVGGTVEVCHNLRPVAGGGGLEPVGHPLAAKPFVDDEADERPSAPTVRITGTTVGLKRGVMPAFAFKGDYTGRDNMIGDDDLSRLSTAVIGAVETAFNSAACQGLAVGCVIARCRFRDRAGMIVGHSLPVLVTAGDSGVASTLEADVTMVDGYYRQVAASSVTLPAFSLAVSAPEGIEAGISAIEVLATPSLLPVDPDAKADCRLSVVDGARAVMQISIPGVSLGAPHDAARRMVAAALARLDMLEQLVAVIEPGALAGSATVEVTPSGGRSFESTVSAVGRCLSASVEVGGGLMSLLGSGCSVEAGVRTTVGDIVVSADLTVGQPQAPSPAALAASGDRNGRWRGYCRVTTGDDGGCVVTSVNGSGMVPGAVGPLVTFPGGAACEIEVRIGDSTGRVSAVKLPLTPSADRRFSYWLSDDLKPIELQTIEGDYLVPAAIGSVSRYKATVAVSRVGAPDEFTAVTTLDGYAAITAVTAVPRQGSTVDFGRTALYLFTTGGIFTMSVNASRTVLSVSALDGRAVDGPHAVARLASSMLVIAGGDLVRLNGSLVTTLAPAVEWRRIGHCASRSETWMADAEGNVTVIAADGTLYSRDDVAVASMRVEGGALYLIDKAGLTWLADRETRSAKVAVAWRGRRQAAGRLTVVESRLAAEDCDLTVNLKADGGRGSDHAVSLLSLALARGVNHPVVTRVVAPPRLWLTVDVAGSVDGSALLEGFVMEYRTINKR